MLTRDNVEDFGNRPFLHGLIDPRRISPAELLVHRVLSKQTRRPVCRPGPHPMLQVAPDENSGPRSPRQGIAAWDGVYPKGLAQREFASEILDMNFQRVLADAAVAEQGD